MSEMIEKVARAIWEQPLGDFDEITSADHPRLLAIARAAIEAMRETTDEIERLRQALEPFANATITPNGEVVGLERFWFERARATLSSVRRESVE